MLELLRLQALIESTNVDYTDRVLLRELTHAQQTKFPRLIVDAKANYWLQFADYQTTPGQRYYRLPARALTLSKIELGPTDAATVSGFIRLPETNEDRINIWESPPSSRGQPLRFVLRGDSVFLDPPPDTAYTLRVWYYVRPQILTPPLVVNNAGLVLTVNTTTRVVTMAAAIQGWTQSTGTFTGNITSSSGFFDIIATGGGLSSTNRGGWRELAVCDAAASIDATGLIVTFAPGVDVSRVQNADVLRLAGQSEWPSLPDEYHRCLVDVATIKVLTQRDFLDKAADYAGDVAADIERFAYLIADRVQEDPSPHRADLPSLRMGRYFGGWR